MATHLAGDIKIEVSFAYKATDVHSLHVFKARLCEELESVVENAPDELRRDGEGHNVEVIGATASERP